MFDNTYRNKSAVKGYRGVTVFFGIYGQVLAVKVPRA